jgi:hypothetical protein
MVVFYLDAKVLLYFFFLLFSPFAGDGTQSFKKTMNYTHAMVKMLRRKKRSQMRD